MCSDFSTRPGLRSQSRPVFGGLGFWEISIILGIALIILGPTKLPELARSFGKGLREFRKATEEFKSTIDTEVHRPDPPKASARIESPKPAATMPSTPSPDPALTDAAPVGSEPVPAAQSAVESAEPSVEAEPVAGSGDEAPAEEPGKKTA